MQRFIYQQLQAWKLKKSRKPLIIKGVRQTGKTYILKEFGRLNFSHVHYLNFELQQQAASLFKGDLEPRRIMNDLSFLLNHPIDIQNDLVIFDEIQACPPALTSLKYFAELLPELALCCAGSLLGLHLNESSFPVGKVDFLHMRPMCFAEFLEANNDTKALKVMHTLTAQSTLSDIAHQHLWEQLKRYFITGGLPEVVKTYIESNADLFTTMQMVRAKQNEIIFGYYADIAKHSGKVNAMHIDRIWRAIPTQLAKNQDGSAQRFQFKGIIPGIDRYHRLANVFDWLQAAELIIKVPIVEHVEQPLSAFVKEHFFKLYLFDVGILGALADLAPKTILDYDYGTYKGYFAENFVAEEFVMQGKDRLYSWQDQRAEIEFLYPFENHILPIEVKSGWVTKNQSMQKYAGKYHPLYKTVLSAKSLCLDLTSQYHHYPLYMAYWFPVI